MLETGLNSLPNDKILDVTKLKAFADDKINLAQMMISVIPIVENMVGKGAKMLVTSIFSFSHNVFKRILSWGCSKSGLCGTELKPFSTKTVWEKDIFLCNM